MRIHWVWSVVCALSLCACGEPHGAGAAEEGPGLEADAGSDHWNEGPSEEGPRLEWPGHGNPCEGGPSEDGPCDDDPADDEHGQANPCDGGPSEQGPCDEEPEEEEPNEKPRKDGCARTQGYWKNHGWGTVVGLTLGSTYYTEEEARALLWTSPRGDASLILAHQLIAALLNVASGASPHSAIADAQQWMRNNGSRLAYGTTQPNATRARAIELAEQLAAYNEGRAGVLHCDRTGGGSPPSAPPSEEPPY